MGFMNKENVLIYFYNYEQRSFNNSLPIGIILTDLVHISEDPVGLVSYSVNVFTKEEQFWDLAVRARAVCMG